MNAEIVGWRAWYTGGRAFDSGSTRWEDLPDQGLLVLVLYDRLRPWRQLLMDASRYWIDSLGQWHRWGWRSEEPEESVIDPADVNAGRVKRGGMASDIEMDRVYYQAMDAREAPDESLRISRPRPQEAPWHDS